MDKINNNMLKESALQEHMSFSERIAELYPEFCDKYFASLTSFLLVFFTPGTRVFAAGESIITVVSNLLQDWYGQIIGLAAIACAITLAWNLLKRMFVSNQQAVAKINSDIVKSVVSLIGCGVIGLIISTVNTMTAGYGYTGF